MNHQTPVNTTRPMTASKTGPPAPRSAGPAQPARTEQPTSRASQISRRSMSLAPRLSSSKARSVQTLHRRGRSNTAQDEKHPGGPGDGAGGGSRGGEQAADISGRLLVQAQVPGQPAGRRPPRQGIGDDQEREEAQQQRGREQHAPVDEIHRSPAGATDAQPG